MFQQPLQPLSKQMMQGSWPWQQFHEAFHFLCEWVKLNYRLHGLCSLVLQVAITRLGSIAVLIRLVRPSSLGWVTTFPGYGYGPWNLASSSWDFPVCSGGPRCWLSLLFLPSLLEIAMLMVYLHVAVCAPMRGRGWSFVLCSRAFTPESHDSRTGLVSFDLDNAWAFAFSQSTTCPDMWVHMCELLPYILTADLCPFIIVVKCFMTTVRDFLRGMVNISSFRIALSGGVT